MCFSFCLVFQSQVDPWPDPIASICIKVTCGSHANNMWFTCHPHVVAPYVVHMLTTCGSHGNHM